MLRPFRASIVVRYAPWWLSVEFSRTQVSALQYPVGSLLCFMLFSSLVSACSASCSSVVCMQPALLHVGSLLFSSVGLLCFMLPRRVLLRHGEQACVPDPRTARFTLSSNCTLPRFVSRATVSRS